jgi:hypothetical protein
LQVLEPVPMGQVLPFHDLAFAPEVTAAMASAFERACQTDGHTQVDLVREIIAKRIVELAGRGNADEEHLYLGALRALGLERQACDIASGKPPPA